LGRRKYTFEKMKIALLAPPYLPVPPVGYGGTERIVAALADGLVDRGHDVTLFASGDSHTRARLHPIVPKAIGNSGEIKNKPLIPLLAYTTCFSRASEFEIIHNHAQYLAMFLAQFSPVPVVHTLHGSIYQGEVPLEKRNVLMQFARQGFISISNDQRKALPQLNWIATVYNGINLSEFTFVDRAGNYLLWVGRVTAKKGALEAIKVAHAVGLPLKMAGVVDPIDRPFYEREILPYIKGGSVEFIGELNAEGKSRLYGGAIATVYPISWHEPFGLVMAESMACGTPVVATRWGSVPEIVADGVTGFVVDTFEELVLAVKKVGMIKRFACRARVEAHFTIQKMIEGYVAAYKLCVLQS